MHHNEEGLISTCKRKNQNDCVKRTFPEMPWGPPEK